jgi:hypothetical protein
MIRSLEVLKAWGSVDFEGVLKKRIEQLDADQLPLQQGLSKGAYATDDCLQAMIIHVSEEPQYIRAKAGIFYTGITTNCNCADDPTPPGEYNEYCVVQIEISKNNAETTISLLPDES